MKPWSDGRSGVCFVLVRHRRCRPAGDENSTSSPGSSRRSMDLGCHSEAYHRSGGLRGRDETVARSGMRARLVAAGAGIRRPGVGRRVRPAAADEAAGRRAFGRGDCGQRIAGLPAASDKEKPKAQFDLGQLCEFGDCVAQDYGRATDLYEKAARQGNIEAACRLSLNEAEARAHLAAATASETAGRMPRRRQRERDQAGRRRQGRPRLKPNDGGHDLDCNLRFRQWRGLLGHGFRPTDDRGRRFEPKRPDRDQLVGRCRQHQQRRRRRSRCRRAVDRRWRRDIEFGDWPSRRGADQYRRSD